MNTESIFLVGNLVYNAQRAVIKPEFDCQHFYDVPFVQLKLLAGWHLKLRALKRWSSTCAVGYYIAVRSVVVHRIVGGDWRWRLEMEKTCMTSRNNTIMNALPDTLPNIFCGNNVGHGVGRSISGSDNWPGICIYFLHIELLWKNTTICIQNYGGEKQFKTFILNKLNKRTRWHLDHWMLKRFPRTWLYNTIPVRECSVQPQWHACTHTWCQFHTPPACGIFNSCFEW